MEVNEECHMKSMWKSENTGKRSGEWRSLTERERDEVERLNG